jgi:2-desacetyl-2-hydroxyethyl bacteriochlorophyllide A dehydrogenase
MTALRGAPLPPDHQEKGRGTVGGTSDRDNRTMPTDALMLDRQLNVVLGTRELPAPQPGQALIRVAWAGVCGSDLHVLKTGAWVAYWPATLGHEVAGVVQECPGDEVPPGTTVVVDSRLPCGTCAGCQTAPSLCERMQWLGEAMPGGFARHLVVPASSLVVCPPHLEPAVAVLAEPLAVAMHAVSKLGRRPSDVLLLGYGPVGALVHLELTRRWPGLPVFVQEKSGDRRQLAMALGAKPARPDQANGDVPVSHPGATRPAGPERFSLVIDAAGFPQSLAQACARATNGGTVLVVAISTEPVALVPADVVERTLAIAGSVGFDDELEQAVSLLAADADRYRPLITEAVLLEEAAERLATIATTPPAGKLLVRPWQE